MYTSSMRKFAVLGYKILGLIFLCSTVNAQTTFQDCSELEQKQILNDISFSKIVIESQMREIYTRFLKNKPASLNFYTSVNRWTRALVILDCTKNVIGELNYKCDDSLNDASAETWPIIGNTVRLSPKHFTFNRQRDRASTLVHEATHKCGATDASYFGRKQVGKKIVCVLPHDKDLVPWDMIASMYDFWTRFGLCDPNMSSCNCNL